MTEQPPQPQPTPDLTTVVGYAEAAPPPPAAPAGLASLRSSVSVVRALVIASLALLLVLALGFVLGIASVRTQVADLSAQVSALAAAQEQAVAAAVQQQAAAAQQPAEQPAAEPERPTIQSTAPTLPEGTVLPGGADQAGAILIGSPNAANVVEVYVDYQCPYCQRWEADIGAALAARALDPAADLLVKQYNLAFLGETSPTLDPPGASARAASAAACVLEGEGAEVFVAFNTRVFASADPAEPASQFATPVMAELARAVGAADATVACIEEERHVPFVAISTQAGFSRGVGGTPTVLLNGEAVDNAFEDPRLLDLLRG